MKAVWTWLLVASTVTGYATATPDLPPTVDSTIASVALPRPSVAPDASPQLLGHQHDEFLLELIPTQMSDVKGADALSIEIKARNYTDGEVSAVVACEVIDDRGNVVVPARLGASQTIGPAAMKSVSTSSTPHGLSDGYYFVRATGAWSGVSMSGTTSAYLYFVMRAGRLSIIGADEWYTYSRAKEGVVQ